MRCLSRPFNWLTMGSLKTPIYSKTFHPFRMFHTTYGTEQEIVATLASGAIAHRHDNFVDEPSRCVQMRNGFFEDGLIVHLVGLMSIPYYLQNSVQRFN